MDGRTIERFYLIGKAPKRIRLDKKWAWRDIVAEHRGMKDTPGNWPMVLWAAGVHPQQVGKSREYCLQMGVPTHYNSDGEPVITDRTHFKRFCRING